MSSEIFVARNTPLTDLYGAECPLSLCSARGILKILRTQEKTLGVYIPVTLNEFIANSATPGFDPFAPMVTITKDLKDKNILTIDGTAIFKGKKIAGILDVTESKGLFWLYSKTPRGIITVDYPDDSGSKINLEIHQLKSKIRPQIDKGKLTMLINTEVKFNLLDITGSVDDYQAEFTRKTEQAASQEITKHINAAINKGQLVGSDFLGFGRNIYRYEPDYWDKIKDDWADLYPQVDTTIRVKTTLSHTNLARRNIFIR